MRNLGIIEDGSVLVVNGAVASVGPTRRIENLAEARTAEEINAAGRVVMPGFIDSHTHLISAPQRLFQVRTANGAHSTVYSKAAGMAAALHYVRTATAANLEFQARKHAEWCLRHGTTTLEGKSGYGLNASSEMKMLRVLNAFNETCVRVVPTFFGGHAVPPESENPAAWIQTVCSELLPKVRERKLARFADVLCDSSGFSAEEARPYLETALRFGIPAKVHADTSGPSGGTRLALEFNAVSADGLNAIGQEEIDLLARSSTVATLMPAPVHLGITQQFAPARRLIDAGAAVALASCFDPSAPSTYSMQTVISLACSHMGMSPEEAISASTINGAHALGLGSRCGSLEFGKDADLLILNVSDYRDIPLLFGGNTVSMALRRGQVVYREGALTWGGE